MPRKLKSTLQILIGVVLAVQLAGCFFVEHDHGRHYGPPGHYYHDHDHDHDHDSGIDIRVHSQ